MSNYLGQAQVEIVMMDSLAYIGYLCAFGPDISTDGPACERKDYDQVVLIGRLQIALENINPIIQPDKKNLPERPPHD